MNRFREQRIKHGYKSQKELADVLFVNQTAVSQWERGVTTPSSQLLVKLSELYGVTTDYLLGHVKEDLASSSLDKHPVSSGVIRIPVLGQIQAGVPMEAIEDVLDWEEIPASWGSGNRQYFGLRVKGDSMYPKYLEGDTVILQKEKTCDNGDDCAVLVNGDAATLKQVFFRDGGAIELRPINPAYPPRTYTPAEIESLPVQVLGIVVELRRKIK